MRIRPFLSHRRQDRSGVIGLKRELRLRGAGGWRDLDDLVVGHPGETAIRRAIRDETFSYVWYGSRRALDSAFIRDVEMPEARHRKHREPTYPIIPLFTNISPDRDGNLIRAAFQPRDGDLLLAASGLTRERRESYPSFHARAADRYVRNAIAALKQDRFTVAITAFTEPNGGHDLTMDWRPVLDERTRALQAEPTATLEHAVLAIRDAVKPKADSPRLILDIDAPLPLAVLAGYAWRVTTRLRLTIRQRTRSAVLNIDGDGPVHSDWPAAEIRDYRATGPSVIAVAVRRPIGHALDAYARTIGAGRGYLIEIGSDLDATGIRGLARHIAAEISSVNARGEETHLLLLGPVALALLTGAAANAAGAIVVPFWNGSEYVSPLLIG